MERKLLMPDEIPNRLGNLEGWSAAGKILKRRMEFDDFAGALIFVNKVGAIAERLDHHPDITFGWGYADIETTTHDRGGITDLDIALAREINSLA
ncbi:MAG: 4a-hydroxytetrahydrobiopterin dehydratase [Acidobacteriota bacterium]